MRLGRAFYSSTSRRPAVLVEPGHVRTQPLRTQRAQKWPIVMAALDSHTLGLASISGSTAAASPVPPWRGNRGRQQQRGRGRGRWRPAGAATSDAIPYTVDEELVETFAAAGVLFYTTSSDNNSRSSSSSSSSNSGIQVLLMRQVDKHGSAWSILGGKVDWRDDPRIPQVTAAREVQEETHDLVEAASLRPLLDGAPQPYYASGRYICYLVRLEDAQQLPAYYNQRVNEGRTNPAAAKCVEAAWFDLDYVVQSATRSKALQEGRVQLRRVALDLGWRTVARWLRQLVAGQAPEQVLHWAAPTGEPEPLEAAPVRRAPSPAAAAAAAAPAGAQQAEVNGSSSSAAVTYKQVAATVEAAAEQWRLANEQLTQMLGALDVNDGAVAGSSGAGGSDSKAECVGDPAASSSRDHHQ